MQPAPTSDITTVLSEVRQGVAGAEDRLAELVYDQLHRMAKGFMRRERADHTLQPTILVHEAFIHLIRDRDRIWSSRVHFYAVAARQMRRMLVDYARANRAKKRGGDRRRLDVLEVDLSCSTDLETILAVDEALQRLSERDERQGRVVELRFFGGMTEEDVAELLGVARKTVQRDWDVARAWLLDELTRT